MSVNSKVAELFAEAIYEGRDDVLVAIAPFISIKEVVDTLDKNQQLFGEKFKEAFLRNEYSGEDINALGMSSLIERIKGYQKFYLSLGSKEGLDDDSRRRFVQSYANKGYYEAALKSFQAIKDKDAYRQELASIFSSWRSASRNPLFIFMGHPSRWNVQATELFSALSLEIDDDFTAYERTSQSSPWTKSRFDAQINAVGQWQTTHHQSIPAVELVNGEIQFTQGQMLAKAFCDEYNKLNSGSRREGWNAKNFPSYLPVKVNAEDLNDLVLQGALPLRKQEASDTIAHGFDCLKGSLTQGQVAMAMSLISLDDIACIHQNTDMQLALLPVSAITPPEVQVDSTLQQRMQWHRPEVLRVLLDKDNIPYCYFSRDASAYLYLRGCPLRGDYLNSQIELGFELINPDLLKYFTANGEQSFIRDTVGAMSYTQSSHDLDAEVNAFVAQYQRAKDYMGIEPKVVIAGDVSFMERVSRLEQEFHIVRALEQDFEDASSHRGNAFCGDYGVSDHHRLAARLCGFQGRSATRYGQEPSELLSKALRLKNDDNAKEEIKGLLDRFPLKEVALAAKTDKQIEFVVQNFDLGEIYADLPPKVRNKIGHTVLSDEFGL